MELLIPTGSFAEKRAPFAAKWNSTIFLDTMHKLLSKTMLLHVSYIFVQG